MRPFTTNDTSSSPSISFSMVRVFATTTESRPASSVVFLSMDFVVFFHGMKPA